MADSKLRDLSMEFSIDIIKLCENTKGHYSLTYWLELFQKSSMIDTVAKSLLEKCGTIRRVLIASINTAKKNS